MEKAKAYSKAYLGTVPVEKVKAGVRTVICCDRDGTIQEFPHPVERPSFVEMGAGEEFRAIVNKYVFIESTAQVLPLATDKKTRLRSVANGRKILPPKILMPNGLRIDDPAEVRGWEYLHNPDAFIGFGSGIDSLRDGAYVHDEEFDIALGGPEWRHAVFEGLDRLYPDGSYKADLGLVDRDGLYERGEVDVAPLEYRVQFDHYGEEGYIQRRKLHRDILKAQAEGTFPDNVTFFDESNPAKGRYTTYLVSLYGEKALGLERYGNALSFHANVPMEEIDFIKIGDSPTDVSSGLRPFQGAKSTTLIVAANSRLEKAIHNNESEFAGMPLMGSPNHPTFPGCYFKTSTAGVYWWQGPEIHQRRQVFLAGLTPWGKGMQCTQSVLATLKEMGLSA